MNNIVILFINSIIVKRKIESCYIVALKPLVSYLASHLPSSQLRLKDKHHQYQQLNHPSSNGSREKLRIVGIGIISEKQ